MPQPTLRQLRTFLAVVEAGSVSAAARALGLTQPAASQQLQELERQLGVRLLDRAAGRSLPTAAGRALLAPARRALAAADDVVAAAAAHRSGDAGRVRIGTGATACIYLLPPALAGVRRCLPGIDLAVSTGNTTDIVRRVEDGELDLGLVTLPVPRSRSLLVTRLLTDSLVAVLPREAEISFGTAVKPDELARLPLILYEPGGNVRRLVDQWFGRAGLTPRPAMELGNVEAIKGLVAGGFGASILPEMAVREGVAGAGLHPLRPSLGRDLGIVLRREKVIDRGLRAVLDELGALGTRPAGSSCAESRPGTALGSLAPPGVHALRRSALATPAPEQARKHHEQQPEGNDAIGSRSVLNGLDHRPRDGEHRAPAEDMRGQAEQDQHRADE